MNDDIKLPPPAQRMRYIGDLWTRDQIRAAVEADRQGRMPSDDELMQLASECCDSTDATGEEPKFTTDESILRFARALLARYSSTQPAASAEPDDMPPLDDRATYPASMIRRLIREDRARRAAPAAQEPVAWLRMDEIQKLPFMLHARKERPEAIGNWIPVYAAPVAAQAQPVEDQCDYLDGDEECREVHEWIMQQDHRGYRKS